MRDEPTETLTYWLGQWAAIGQNTQSATIREHARHMSARIEEELTRRGYYDDDDDGLVYT